MDIRTRPENAAELKEMIETLGEGLRNEIAGLREEVRQLRGQKDPDRLLKPEEAADLLSVDPRTLDRLRAEGKITSVKVRGCRRYPRKAIEAFVRRKAEGRGDA